MVKVKHKGKRSKTRYAFTKSMREKGKPTVNKRLQKFKIGDYVHIHIDSSIHVGMPHRRFNGKTGKVVAIQGKSYVLEVKNMNALRKVIVNPVHLSIQKNIKK